MLPLLAAASLLSGQLELPALPPIRREPQITYLDRTGAVLGTRGGRYGPPADLAKMPPYVPLAFVAIEDRRFFEHAGFDPVGMARALMADIGKGRTAQGASTITQQLARNLYLTSDQTLERKGQELLYAIQLERTYSKREILALYLSRAYFGQGAYGIEAAAERYFGKSAAHLTIKEAAMLASILKAPTDYNPADRPEASARRAELVLAAMEETGAITAAQRAAAAAQQPHVWKTSPTAAAQYFIDWVDSPARKQMGPLKGDVTVDTTLDAGLERSAGEATAAVVARYADRRVGQAAVVTLDGAGRVRAMVGGADYAQSPYNRAFLAHRQAGSAWKAFVYLAAMEAGRTPDTPVVDEPVTIAGWSPRNFEPEFMGPITLETAFAHSVNTVAARLADDIGRPQVAAVARRLGIVSPINTDPAMALGTTLVTPLEMAGAYDAFANGGLRVNPFGIERIRSASGAVLYQRRAPVLAQAIANPPLSEMDRMMGQVIATGTGVRAAIPPFALAGKTGTTSDFKDAWFCGFSGDLVTAVWMGRDDGSPMVRITGGSAPVDLWRAVMGPALRRWGARPIPPGPPVAAPDSAAPPT